jgi:hypothetical protein
MAKTKTDVQTAARNLLNKRLEKHAAWPDVVGWLHAYPDHRAGVLVLTAILEQALESVLTTHFVTDSNEARQLFMSQSDNPLVPFATKIALGYYLGIYPSHMRSDLTLIRLARNDFAHSPEPLTFGHQVIKDLCSHLSTAKVYSFRSALIGGLLGQTPKEQYVSNIGRSASRFHMPEPGTAEHDTWYAEQMRLVERGPPHNGGPREIFWAAAVILISYLWSDPEDRTERNAKVTMRRKPLMFEGSPTYDMLLERVDEKTPYPDRYAAQYLPPNHTLGNRPKMS